MKPISNVKFSGGKTFNFPQIQSLSATILFLVFFAAAQTIVAAPSDVDFSFGSKVIDAATIAKSVVQPDGKILLAGGFDVIVSQPSTYMIRLNADGTRDAGFQSAAPGKIDDFLVQPDGKIVVVGRFYYGSNQCFSFNQCYGIMRLNQNGTYDTTFASGITPNGSQFVNTVALQPDGKFIIGGQFNVYAGQTRGLVARINADGTLDATFQNPNVNNGAYGYEVDSLAVQTDGKVLIGGIFDTVGGQSRISLARINADGTLDSAFVPPTIAGNFTTVKAIALQPDAKILVGGTFSQIGGQNRSLARLNTDGALDSTFQITNFNGSYTVSKIFLQADGKVFLDGAFTGGIQVPGGGTIQKSKARANADGTVDSTLNLDTLSTIYSVALQSNGRVLIIGTLTPPINGNTSVDYFVVREINLDNQTNAIAVQPDGKILIGGTFTSVTGQTRKGLARLNQNGTLDATFPDLNPTFSGDSSITGIRKIVVQPDGKIIIIGGFTNIGGQARINLARLNGNGTIDATFQVPTISYAYGGYLADAVLQSDGKILLGGSFNTVNSQNHKGIARLNADGSLDATLQSPVADGYNVQSIAVQTDGKIITAGNFQTGGVKKTVERLNADGTHDNTFQSVDVNQTAANNGNVNVVRIQTDGKILIGGLFSLINGQAHKFLARLNTDGTLDTSFQDTVFTGSNGIYAMVLQTDGKILVSGSFFTAGGLTRNGFARVNADGSVDTTFGDTGALVNPFSYALAVQRDGKILVGGSFQLISQRVQRYITRLIGTPAGQRAEFDFDNDGRSDAGVYRNGVWYINRSTLGFLAIQFGIATDKIAPADYDGDGRTDIAVWRENVSGVLAYFYILNSSNNTVRIEQFGNTGDRLTVGDWDGDGRADPAVYRDSAAGAQSYFYYAPSTQPSVKFISIPWGTTGDKGLRGDFDGDGKLDAAVYRPSTGTWIISQSSNSQMIYRQFGLSGDKLVPSDYDGDGKTDIAIFRNGTWIILQSATNQVRYVDFGLATDTPIAADYDGDGKSDIAVFRNGLHIILQSSNSQITYLPFGLADDVPIASAYNQ